MMESLTGWAKKLILKKRYFVLFTPWIMLTTYLQTLIISQWTQCLQLVSEYLAENGIEHVK